MALTTDLEVRVTADVSEARDTLGQLQEQVDALTKSLRRLRAQLPKGTYEALVADLVFPVMTLTVDNPPRGGHEPGPPIPGGSTTVGKGA